MKPNRVLVVLMLSPLALALAGCASSATHREGEVTEIEINEAQRLLDARRFAAQAQDTQDPDEAVALYRRAVEAWADFPAAWNNLGVVLLEQGRYLDAAEAFLAARERSGTDPRPTYNLALTWERTRHLQEAAAEYARALEVDGRFLPALRGSVYADDRLGITTEETLERLRTALMVETDDRWRAYFEQRRLAVKAELDDRR